MQSVNDPLDTRFPYRVSRVISPSETLRNHGNTLLSCEHLRDRLQYYNKNICSLAYSFSDSKLQIYGKYDNFYGSGQVFFKKGTGETDPDFEVYLEERQKEIERLKGLIAKQATYKGRLQCYIEAKAGQIRFDELVIRSNEWEKFVANGTGTRPTPAHLLGDNIEIDVRPGDPKEVEVYNIYIRKYCEQRKEVGHWLLEDRLTTFDAVKAMDTIRVNVRMALSESDALNREISRIESQYRHPDFVNYIEYLYQLNQGETAAWYAALFNALVNGNRFNLGKQAFTLDQMQGFLHVEQVYCYYRYLFLLRDKVVFNDFSSLLRSVMAKGRVEEVKSEQVFLAKSALYELLFATWVRKRYSLRYGDTATHRLHLTEREFLLFLKEYESDLQEEKFLIGHSVAESWDTFQRNHHALRERFRIKIPRGNLDRGWGEIFDGDDMVWSDPPYRTSLEAYGLLTNYYASVYFEHEKHLFVEKYKVWNEISVSAEIKVIEAFIEATNAKDYAAACNAFNKMGVDTDEYIYRRLLGGFYEHVEFEKYPFINAIGNREAVVYGRYVLFYRFLKEKLNELDPQGKKKGKATGDGNKPLGGSEDQIQFVLTNNFDGTGIRAYNHFRRELVDRGFLTEHDLREFLVLAFEEKKKPSSKFTFLKRCTKGRMQKIFYDYYCDVAKKPSGKKLLYASLLGDYFQGYDTKTVNANFSR